MTRKRRHWIVIAVSAVAIGCVSALAERTLTHALDSVLPDARRIANFNRPGTITLLSTDGKVIQKLGPATREKVEQDKMPLLVEQAFVAAEDRRFYYHNGLDIWGISRALVTNLRQGSVREGASTITQQLARTV
ncbi:MAG: transglycosylase domain-containing protein, partial [Cyanobacteriota bacterium]|nr:transglycosylase domain-containing protein [Cyanobacteriota bacterium]